MSKDKAPLRELPLLYEILAGKLQLSFADVGASGWLTQNRLLLTDTGRYQNERDQERNESQVRSPRATKGPRRPMASNLLQQDIQID